MTDAEILQQLRQFRQENRQQFEELRSDVSGLNNRLGEAEDRIEKAEERIRASEDAALEMLKLHVRLEEKLTEMESRSRRDNLRIYGVLLRTNFFARAFNYLKKCPIYKFSGLVAR